MLIYFIMLQRKRILYHVERTLACKTETHHKRMLRVLKTFKILLVQILLLHLEAVQTVLVEA